MKSGCNRGDVFCFVRCRGGSMCRTGTANEIKTCTYRFFKKKYGVYSLGSMRSLYAGMCGGEGWWLLLLYPHRCCNNEALHPFLSTLRRVSSVPLFPGSDWERNPSAYNTLCTNIVHPHRTASIQEHIDRRG